MNAGWCVHYTGLMGRAGERDEERRCAAGVLYEEVRLRRNGDESGSVPCVASMDRGLTVCALRRFPSKEEVAAADALALERLTQHAQVVSAGICPHCGRDMTSRKVGRCLYANPCGHRLNEIPSVIRGLDRISTAR